MQHSMVNLWKCRVLMLLLRACLPLPRHYLVQVVEEQGGQGLAQLHMGHIKKEQKGLKPRSHKAKHLVKLGVRVLNNYKKNLSQERCLILRSLNMETLIFHKQVELSGTLLEPRKEY